MAADRRDLARELDEKTRTEDLQPARRGRGAGVLTLTILCHPDCARIGEEAVLGGRRAGERHRLSRREPEFFPPSGGDGRPLAEPHLSREPWSVVTVEGGGVRLEAGGSRTRVRANGVEIEEQAELTAERVRDGVVLEMASAVALLLKWMKPRIEPAEGARYGLVGESSAMIDLRQEIGRVAGSEVSVLLRGETGTGKELVARALHDAGPRSRGPFVSVNMAALPPDLVAAELFGTVEGAFTGASRRRLGYFRRADRGTLFLDEIGDVPISVQSALLRVLESGEVQAVGSSQSVAVDVRVVAASDSDLEAAVARGEFRGPLLHRLMGYEIEMPPLRARREDIGRLLLHFLREELEESGELWKLEPPEAGAAPWLAAHLVARLAMLDWPGNVRQLRNLARQLVIGSRGIGELRLTKSVRRLLAEETSDGDEHSGDLTPAVAEKPPRPPSPYRDPHSISEDELLEALRAHRFRIKPTAKHLNIARSSLYDLMDRCPRVRKASDLTRPDVLAAVARHGADLGAMAEELEVSPEGLRKRLRELGL